MPLDVSSRTVATLARLSKPLNIVPKSPPKSMLNSSSSSFGGVAVLVVEEVKPRGLGVKLCAGTGGGASSTGGMCFLVPKEKVRPARFKKPEPDLGTEGRGASASGLL